MLRVSYRLWFREFRFRLCRSFRLYGIGGQWIFCNLPPFFAGFGRFLTQMKPPPRFFEAKSPVIHPTAFVAPSADVVGDVVLGEDTSVWFQSVLRGDINRIEIGRGSNIQDGVVVHLSNDLPVVVGEYVTCGHRAILHACVVGDEVLVGMGATVMDGAEIGARSMVAAGALVPPGMKVAAGSLVMGVPGKVVRVLDAVEQRKIRGWAEKYVEVARHYRERMGSKAGVEI